MRFELLSDPNKAFGLEIYDDVILGRDMRGPEFVDLSFFDAALQGVSRERVRQIEAQALSRLRHPVIRRKLRDYLGD